MASTPTQVVCLRALARDIVLCSWAGHFTLTVPLSTEMYKWVSENLMPDGNPGLMGPIGRPETIYMYDINYKKHPVS